MKYLLIRTSRRYCRRTFPACDTFIPGTDRTFAPCDRTFPRPDRIIRGAGGKLFGVDTTFPPVGRTFQSADTKCGVAEERFQSTDRMANATSWALTALRRGGMNVAERLWTEGTQSQSGKILFETTSEGIPVPVLPIRRKLTNRQNPGKECGYYDYFLRNPEWCSLIAFLNTGRFRRTHIRPLFFREGGIHVSVLQNFFQIGPHAQICHVIGNG